MRQLSKKSFMGIHLLRIKGVFEQYPKPALAATCYIYSAKYALFLCRCLPLRQKIIIFAAKIIKQENIYTNKPST